MTHILKERECVYFGRQGNVVDWWCAQNITEGYICGWHRRHEYTCFQGRTLYLHGQAFAHMVGQGEGRVILVDYDRMKPAPWQNYPLNKLAALDGKHLYVPFINDCPDDPFEYRHRMSRRRTFDGSVSLLPDFFRKDILRECKHAARRKSNWYRTSDMTRATALIENANLVAEHFGWGWRLNLHAIYAEAEALVKEARRRSPSTIGSFEDEFARAVEAKSRAMRRKRASKIDAEYSFDIFAQ